MDRYDGRADGKLRAFGTEHPFREPANSVVWQAHEYVFAMAILLALLYGKTLSEQRMPPVVDSDPLKVMCIM
jgi:hypothetical protein